MPKTCEMLGPRVTARKHDVLVSRDALNQGSRPVSTSQQKKHREGAVFVGCAECTIFELLQQHRKEVVAVKEQMRYMREALTKNT